MVAQFKQRITERDKGYKATVKAARAFKLGAQIKVGVFGDDEVERIATYHEFGLGVPERSFVRAWFDANKNRCKADIARATRQITLRGAPKGPTLHRLASRWAKEMQSLVLAGLEPALKEATIRQKEANIVTPLVTVQARLLSAIVGVVDGKVAK